MKKAIAFLFAAALLFPSGCLGRHCALISELPAAPAQLKAADVPAAEACCSSDPCRNGAAVYALVCVKQADAAAFHSVYIGKRYHITGIILHIEADHLILGYNRSGLAMPYGRHSASAGIKVPLPDKKLTRLREKASVTICGVLTDDPRGKSIAIMEQAHIVPAFWQELIKRVAGLIPATLPFSTGCLVPGDMFDAV